MCPAEPSTAEPSSAWVSPQHNSKHLQKQVSGTSGTHDVCSALHSIFGAVKLAERL